MTFLGDLPTCVDFKLTKFFDFEQRDFIQIDETIQIMSSLATWTSGKNLLKSIRLCDIVEFNRIKYSHYGFYIGNGICVHVQGPDGSLQSSRSNSKSQMGVKSAQRLVDIAGSDLVRVNNSELIAFQLKVDVRPSSEAIKLAIAGLPTDSNGDVIIEKSIPVSYFVISSSNCEGWSTYWRYNHPSGWSIQAVNGAVHSTFGTIERFTDEIICAAEEILVDKDSSTLKKASAAAVIVPYAAVKYTAVGVKAVADVAAGGLMKLFS